MKEESATHAHAKGHKRNLTSRMGHTGQTRHFVVLGWIADPLLLTAQKGRRVDHRVRAVAQAGQFDGGLLLHSNDSTPAEGTGTAAAATGSRATAGARTAPSTTRATTTTGSTTVTTATTASTASAAATASTTTSRAASGRRGRQRLPWYAKSQSSLGSLSTNVCLLLSLRRRRYIYFPTSLFCSSLFRACRCFHFSISLVVASSSSLRLLSFFSFSFSSLFLPGRREKSLATQTS